MLSSIYVVSLCLYVLNPLFGNCKFSYVSIYHLSIHSSTQYTVYQITLSIHPTIYLLTIQLFCSQIFIVHPSSCFSAGGQMSICGAPDGNILVYRSSSSSCYCLAANLPLPHHGYSTLQEGLSSILPRD